MESAWKLARSYHSSPATLKTKVISRETAYHGTTSARSDHRHHTRCGPRSSRSCRGPATRRTRTTYHWDEDKDPLWTADEIERIIEFEGPEPSPR